MVESAEIKRKFECDKTRYYKYIRNNIHPILKSFQFPTGVKLIKFDVLECI